MSNVFFRMALAAAAILLAAGCVSSPGGTHGGSGAPHYKVGKPYKVNGRWYRPAEDPGYDRRGVASWYGADFHGRATANGETYDMRKMTAAHTTLPLPSLVEVTNLENGRKTVVRVNDRGPFAHNRIIDLSRAAARKLGFERNGLAQVRVRYLAPAPLPGQKTGPVYARTEPAAAPLSAALSPVSVAAGADHLASIIAGADPGREPNLPPPLPPEAVGLYAVQIAILDNIEKLPALRADLADEGTLRIARADGDDGAGPARYRINLGPFRSESAASERLEAVRKAGYAGAMIVAISP